MNELKERLEKLASQDGCEIDIETEVDYLMQLIETYTTRKELEARIDELERLYLVYGSPEQPATLDNVFILGEKGKTATLPAKDRLTQLSTELKDKKEQ